MSTKLVKLTEEQQSWLYDALTHRAQAAWDTPDEDMWDARIAEFQRLCRSAKVTR